MKAVFFCLVALSLLLSGCGDTRLERAGNGAILGMFAGGAVGALCCADPIDGIGIGAAIGAAGGAAIGALSPRPLFFNHESEYWPYDSSEPGSAPQPGTPQTP